MDKILKLYKKEGETPLETIESFKRENPEYKQDPKSPKVNGQVKMTYAGRLDPMAEGVLVVLVGEECKNKEKYLGLDKEYEFEILWGFETDTHDILGLPKKGGVSGTPPFPQISDVEKKLNDLKGKQIFEYPAYSSATVGGKQLFQWAREGRLGEIEIPKREVEIYDIEYLGGYEISQEKLLKNITERIKKVKGDFRQEEIIQKWLETKTAGVELPHKTAGAQLPQEAVGVELPQELSQDFVVSKFRVRCSGGTYVRAIVNRLGKELGVGATTFSIKRTRVGNFGL